MKAHFTRAEAHQLQFRWVGHVIHKTSDDPDIEDIVEKLSQAWNAGKVLGLAERQALAVKAAFERMPDFASPIEETTRGVQRYNQQMRLFKEIEAFFGISEMNADEWASNTGPAESNDHRII